MQALKGVSLNVSEGQFFGLLGPNGAGKTTIIGILTGLVNKTSGEVSVMGHDLDTETALAKATIGLVPQEFNFNIFETVENILVNQAGYYGIPRREAIRRSEGYLRQPRSLGQARRPSTNAFRGHEAQTYDRPRSRPSSETAYS